jgi:hypothetical protein
LVAVDSECLEHLSAVVTEKAEVSTKILDRHRESLRASLFVISCSGFKTPDGVDPNWNLVLHHEQYPEFNPSRLDLAEAISHGDRVRYCPNRDIHKAVTLNALVFESKTLPAIRRYAGKLYAQLSSPVKDALATGEIVNLLIISALHGPTSPLDLVPTYDLTMKDSIDDELLKMRWPVIIQHIPHANLIHFVQGFHRCVAPIGLDYLETARMIANQASIPFTHIPLNDYGGLTRAGKLLNEIFSAGLGEADV